MQPAFLHLQKVSYSYPGGQPVLHDLDLEINRNDLLVIRGESGAGKSTFLKLFNRFCDVHKGEMFFNGKALSEYDIDRLRSKVIYLPQLPLMINGTIRDNLYFPFTFHSHMHKEFNPAKAEKWLDYFQVDAWMSPVPLSTLTIKN
jgi:ABC-type multidrug transport system fused ATPase/permease subunit